MTKQDTRPSHADLPHIDAMQHNCLHSGLKNTLGPAFRWVWIQRPILPRDRVVAGKHHTPVPIHQNRRPIIFIVVDILCCGQVVIIDTRLMGNTHSFQ
eukprot:scaffold4936_cov165-Amphora_coffeaeformis.AAC.2